MKKLLIPLMSFMIAFYNSDAQCGFTANVSQCCVTVSVIPNAYPRWILEFGDDAIITSSDVDSTVATYCFDALGNYEIVLTYLDENSEPKCGASVTVQIERPCDCVQWLCWDMLANCCVMDSITGFEIIVDSIPVIIDLPPTYVSGAYPWLSDTLVTILESYNYGGQFYQNYEPIIQGCKKGNDPIPGFFFVNSSVQIVRILGRANCNFPIPPPEWRDTKVEFESKFCDF